MATQDPRTIVKISTVLWSDQVAMAELDEVIPPFDPAYKFKDKEFVVKEHYMPANPVETP